MRYICYLSCLSAFLAPRYVIEINKLLEYKKCKNLNETCCKLYRLPLEIDICWVYEGDYCS